MEALKASLAAKGEDAAKAAAEQDPDAQATGTEG